MVTASPIFWTDFVKHVGKQTMKSEFFLHWKNRSKRLDTYVSVIQPASLTRRKATNYLTCIKFQPEKFKQAKRLFLLFKQTCKVMLPPILPSNISLLSKMWECTRKAEGNLLTSCQGLALSSDQNVKSPAVLTLHVWGGGGTEETHFLFGNLGTPVWHPNWNLKWTWISCACALNYGLSYPETAL